MTPLGTEVCLGPWRHSVTWGTQIPLKRKSPRIFGPCLLWPNGWMDKDATWYGARPRSRRHCDGDQAPPKRGPHFSAHVYRGQTAGWIKMPQGTKVGLCAGHIVLDRDPSPPKEAQPPIFGPCLLWPKGRPSQLLLGTC